MSGRRTRFFVSSCSLLGAWVVVGPSSVDGQTVVPIHEEPRHRLVHDAAALRVLDIGIQPGDTTLFHRHDRPIAYVEIDAALVNQQRLGGPWGDVSASEAPPLRRPGRMSWNERYAEVPVTHRVTAIGSSPFRLIGVLSRGPGVEAARAGPLGPFDEPDASSRYFGRVRMELAEDASLTWPSGAAPVVLILASAGEITVESGAAGPVASSSLSAPGAFVVLSPGAGYRIRNQGDATAILAFVEVR